MGAGRYVNYLGDDEARDAVSTAYGPNYRRLQQIKATYDPANFFRMAARKIAFPERRA